MALVPVPASFADGLAPSAPMNAGVRDVLRFLLAPPMATLQQQTVQSIPNSVMTAMLFDVDIYDPVDGHSTSVNTSRYTAVYPGRYQLSAGTGFATNATNRRANRFAVNGTFVNGSSVYLPATPTGTTETPSRTVTVFLNVGDYVEFHVYQDSGGALNTSVTTDTYSGLEIRWVGN